MEQSFETKISGEEKHFSSGMKRDANTSKPRFDLILPKQQDYTQTMLFRWAALLKRGADNYGARNWELASTQEELDRYKESALRHMIQWFCGETDEDHAAAVFFNITGAEYVKTKLQKVQ